jgi:hypothetical protein
VPVNRNRCAARSTATLAGQAQKEVHVNEAIERLDALLFLAIESEAAAPPASPADGKSWLIGVSPSGDWSGRAGQIASRQSGNWLFTPPQAGMRLLNKATGQDIRFVTSWNAPAKPTAPSGGTAIDAEARTTIGAILAVLVAVGIVPAS